MRRLQFVCVVALLAVSRADGGATIQFRFDPPLGWENTVPPNSEITVDVQLVQDAGGSDQRLRMVELDFSQTNPFLGIVFPTTHDKGTVATDDDIRLWRFDSLAGCLAAPSFCGFNHYIDSSLAAGVVDTREKMVSATFFGTAADPTAQLLLTGGAYPSPVTIARFMLRTSSLWGSYTLDVVNAADPDANRRARVDFGFDPHLTWRAGWASPNNISGGVVSFYVGILGGSCEVFSPSLVSSVPIFTPVGVSAVPPNGSLWRSQRNVIRLAFSKPLYAPPPNAGEILIQQALPGYQCGQEPINFGPDFSSQFEFSIEPPNVLRIEEVGSVFQHRTWWIVRNLGLWGEVCPFSAYYPVQVGDATGDSRVLAADVLAINSRVSCVNNCGGDQVREDMNGDERILASDVLEANARVSSLPVMRPCGH
jgi:hypothetical protein